MSGIKLLCLACFFAVLGCSEVSGFVDKAGYKFPKIPFRWRQLNVRYRVRGPVRLPVKGKEQKEPCQETTEPPSKAPRPQFVHSSGLPYCKESQDINKILKQRGKLTKRSVPWPYECNYASIVKYQGNYQFIWPIHDCCKKCSFPAFTDCVATSTRSGLPPWVCPSDGLHCIVECVKTHGPKEEVSKAKSVPPSLGKPGAKVITRKKSGAKVTTRIKPEKRPAPVKPNNFKCTEVKTVNGKKCIRQLCIPLLKTRIGI